MYWLFFFYIVLIEGFYICLNVHHVKHFVGFSFFFFLNRFKNSFLKERFVALLGLSMKVNHFIPEKNPKGNGGGEKVEKSWKWITERAGKSIIIVNLNQSLLLQKDSRLVFIGAHAYNLKKKEKEKGDGATEPWPQIFILSEKKRGEGERKKWTLTSKISGGVSAEALMSRSQKELWKPEILFRRRTGAHTGWEGGGQHTPSASSTG